jgi:choline dehydrogenase-like flavoprotein
MVMGTSHYDIVIIGTGAGGGTIAHHLAKSGKKILILERGGYLPREKDNWSSHAVFVDSKYKAHETWYDKDKKPFHPGIHYYVGGNTKVYGAALLRMRKEDFGEVRHHGGISPAWPIKYEDLSPYYTQAEKLYHVHGQRGEDPTEPPADAPYFYPPVKHEPRIQELFDNLKAIGHKPFHLPLGLRLNESDMAHSPCIKCSTCDGFPCLVHAKADAEVICIRPALQNPNVTLVLGAYVEKLETSASGREITKIIVKREGKEEVYSGNIVIVSCGAINSSALLLRSANDSHPHGLANSSGVVGRHYMCHNNSALVAISTRLNNTVFEKTLGLNDYYFGSDDWEFPLGHIQMLGKSDGEMFKGDAPPFTPMFVLNAMGRHALDFWLTSEDLPDPNNRVTLDSNGTIHLHQTINNLEGHVRLVQKLKDMLAKIGLESHVRSRRTYLGKTIPIAGTAHQVGTVRFGLDPKTSALDIHCKAHDLDNLYVVDGSFFVSSSAVNPGLTIISNALRVGDHILERMR